MRFYETVTPKHHSNHISRFWLIVSAIVLFALAATLAGAQDVPIPPDTKPPPEPPKVPVLRLTPRAELEDESVSFRGRISRIEGKDVSIDVSGEGTASVVSISRNTNITLNGRAMRLSDLRPGDYVKVTLDPANPETVVELDAGRPTFVRVGQAEGRKGPSRDRDTGRTDAEVTEPLSERPGLGLVISDSPKEGVLIILVRRETPAWRAGLKSGDYLLSLDQVTIDTPEDYLDVLRRQDVEESVRLKIWRDGQIMTGSSELTTSEIAGDVIVDNGLALLLEQGGIDRAIISAAAVETHVDPRTPLVDDEPNDEEVRDDGRNDPSPNSEQRLRERVRVLEQENRRLRQRLNP